jgi:hypothetical protein
VSLPPTRPAAADFGNLKCVPNCENGRARERRVNWRGDNLKLQAAQAEAAGWSVGRPVGRRGLNLERVGGDAAGPEEFFNGSR